MKERSLSLAFAKLSTDRKSTRLNSRHVSISYAVFCLKKNVHAHEALPFLLPQHTICVRLHDHPERGIVYRQTTLSLPPSESPAVAWYLMQAHSHRLCV